jgi:hypothetical protein
MATNPGTGIVLIGSGPSLNRIDPRQFLSLDTITFNRSWLAWSDWGFAPTFHACLDPLSMAIIAPELPPVVAAHKSTHFFLHSSAAKAGIEAGGRVTLCNLMPGTGFSGSLSSLTDFGNVGAISMQILHALGYRKVLMVGVDGDYQPETDVRRDANHFRPDYAVGRMPLTPAERARYTVGWPAVAAECQRHGLEVRNASPRTVLTCFPTIDFGDGLDWLARTAAPAVNA